jgi:uncharacterized membrane protein
MCNLVGEFRKTTLVENISCIALLAFTAFCCSFPLIANNALFDSHDIKFHLFQSDQFFKSITNGSLFPKWALNSNNGYGSASLMFYSPLSYYVVAIFHFFMPSIIQSMIAAIWCSFFLAGISMFFAANKLAGYATGLFCGVLYQFCPYHIFDLYSRGALAELFAFIWFPLIFLFLHRIQESKSNYTILASNSLPATSG